MKVAFHPKGCHPSAQTLGSRKLNSTPSKCTIRVSVQESGLRNNR
ncbi:hypothetical protein [Wolbachia endosymbiont of Psylliodes chrysocephala]|nr:hypothetical protein [Wolbachia endosymbiont of Psylliodes chrysocephala]